MNFRICIFCDICFDFFKEKEDHKDNASAEYFIFMFPASPPVFFL